MRSISQLVDDLYAAFAAHDAAALLAVVSPDFVGHVSQGMPGGVGGMHQGPQAMLEDVWIPTFVAFGATPVPESSRLVEDGSLVVHGWYVRPEGADIGGMRAEFVHLIEADGEGVTALRQVTDTASWTPGR